MSTSLLAPRPGADHADRGPEAGTRGGLSAPLPPDRVLGWLGPLAVTLVAGLLRFWRLGDPHAFVFDETYYAKDAFSLLRFGTERAFVDGANDRLLRGDLNVFAGQPAFVAHPPVGKWVIALGEAGFGVDPFGWRFSVAVLGTLSVLMLARIARRLFRSTLLGCTAGLLLTFDGLHFVQSRTALLDPILMFFLLAAFGCLLLDRDSSRERLRVKTEAQAARFAAHGLGPGLGWRPWRLAAGVFLGLACGTKWSGIFFVTVFGLLTVAWDYGARKAAGVRRPALGAVLRDGPGALFSLVGIAVVVYVSSWAGWFAARDAWGRRWAPDEVASGGMPDSLRSLWHYHAEMWRFNRGLREFHPYASNPWSWPLLGRPVSFHYEGLKQGAADCAVESCSRAVTALGTPAVWWVAFVAAAVTAVLWLGSRDWRAGAITAGLVAGYLPWFAFQGRTIYSFYGIAFLPWLVLAVTFCLGLLLGPPTASAVRRRRGAMICGAYLLLVVLNFFWLYPVLSAETVPYAEWAARMWLRSWI